MKHVLCLILTVLLLCGCDLHRDQTQESVYFYYLRNEISYRTGEGVIAPEALDSAGHGEDPGYLLALYLAGPTGGHLRSPFPKDVRLDHVRTDQATLTVTLTGSFEAMEGLEITKACACLAMTCFGMTDCQTVSIHLLDREENSTKTTEITRDSLILEDLIPETT